MQYYHVIANHVIAYHKLIHLFISLKSNPTWWTHTNKKIIMPAYVHKFENNLITMKSGTLNQIVTD